MAAQLDPVSQLLGNLDARVESLDETFKQHCNDDKDRHDENIGRFDKIADRLDKIESSIHELARKALPVLPTVPPDGDGPFPRKVIVAAASTGLALLTVLVWIFTKAAEWLIGWALSHFH